MRVHLLNKLLLLLVIAIGAAVVVSGADWVPGAPSSLRAHPDVETATLYKTTLSTVGFFGALYGNVFQVFAPGTVTQLWWYSDVSYPPSTKLRICLNAAPYTDLAVVAVPAGANRTGWLSVNVSVPVMGGQSYLVYREHYVALTRSLFTQNAPPPSISTPLLTRGVGNVVSKDMLSVTCTFTFCTHTVSIYPYSTVDNLVDVSIRWTEPTPPSTTFSLRPQHDVPAPVNILKSQNPMIQSSGGLLGDRFIPTINGSVTHLWWYHDPVYYGNTTAMRLDVEPGVRLARVVATGARDAGWQSVALPSPVRLTSGKAYYVYREQPPGLLATYTNDPPMYRQPALLYTGYIYMSCTAGCATTIPTVTSSTSFEFLVDVSFDFGALPALAAPSSSTGPAAPGPATSSSSSSSSTAAAPGEVSSSSTAAPDPAPATSSSSSSSTAVPDPAPTTSSSSSSTAAGENGYIESTSSTGSASAGAWSSSTGMGVGVDSTDTSSAGALVIPLVIAGVGGGAIAIAAIVWRFVRRPVKPAKAKR